MPHCSSEPAVALTFAHQLPNGVLSSLPGSRTKMSRTYSGGGASQRSEGPGPGCSALLWRPLPCLGFGAKATPTQVFGSFFGCQNTQKNGVFGRFTLADGKLGPAGTGQKESVSLDRLWTMDRGYLLIQYRAGNLCRSADSNRLQARRC